MLLAVFNLPMCTVSDCSKNLQWNCHGIYFLLDRFFNTFINSPLKYSNIDEKIQAYARGGDPESCFD